MKKALKQLSLMKSFGKEQQFFKVFNYKSAKATNGSFQILRKIAASGKCFTDGELVKKCILLAVLESFPQKMRMYQNISLSRMTIQRWATDIAANLMA